MKGGGVAVAVSTAIAIASALLSGFADGNSHQPSWHMASGALDYDCSHAGANPDGSVQFIPTCPQSAQSPDDRLQVIQIPKADSHSATVTYLADGDGNMLGHIPKLDDDMPFVLLWSPRRDWLLTNQWIGSGLERPRVFELTSNGLIEHSQFIAPAVAEARRISPCLHHRELSPAEVTGTGMQWSRDGRQLAWLMQLDVYACVGIASGRPPDPSPQPFAMISDMGSGQIITGSIRPVGEDHFVLPDDGPYAAFLHPR